MQNEFKRFKLEKFTKLTGILELLGGIGLLVGLKFGFILLISSGGLALLDAIRFWSKNKSKRWFLALFSFFVFYVIEFICFHSCSIDAFFAISK